MDYEKQLDRAIEKTPDITDESGRFSIPDPTVREEGSTTVFENFQSTVDRFGREDTHVIKFLQSELGTNGEIDESGRARLTGSFRETRISDALDEYAEEFVLCNECGLPDTRFGRERGARMLRCEACGAISPTGE